MKISFLLLFLGISIFGAAIAQADSKAVFELRTYTTHDGRLAALNERFVNHTRSFFKKHGMRNIGYWVPTDPEKSGNTLIYIVAHESRKEAEHNWQSFGQDPGWQKVYAQSVEDGPIVERVESVFMSATDYSNIQ